jgi:stress-induced morphogen
MTSSSSSETVNASSVESRIRAHLDNDVTHLQVIDQSDGICVGGKFTVLVVSPKFDAVSLIDRHKLINAALAPFLNQIHALSIKAWTPEQWKKKQAENNTQ